MLTEPELVPPEVVLVVVEVEPVEVVPPELDVVLVELEPDPSPQAASARSGAAQLSSRSPLAHVRALGRVAMSVAIIGVFLGSALVSIA